MDSCFALLGVHQQVSEEVTLKFMCVGPWAGITYLPYTVLMSPKKGETAVHCCDPALSVLVMLVSRKAFHIVSALQPIVCLNTIFLADQISCRSYVSSDYGTRSLAMTPKTLSSGLCCVSYKKGRGSENFRKKNMFRC